MSPPEGDFAARLAGAVNHTQRSPPSGGALPAPGGHCSPAGTPAYLLDDDGSTRSVEAAILRAQENKK